MNSSSTEVVRSLFHNKSNCTLIIVSVHASDGYSSLRCRASQLDDLRVGDAHSSCSLFTSESLKWPGFVEFDDVNQKVLTYSADEKTYKVWSMADPSEVLYALPDAQIQEIKISPGIMLLVLTHECGGGHVPLKILSIETGQVLREFNQLVRRGKKIDVIEQFNQKLLLKQEDAPLSIVDLISSSVIKVPERRFKTPLAFIFLYEHQCFLAFRSNEVLLWNFRGELVSQFCDHRLWFPQSVVDHTSVIFITHSQDVIISLCEDRPHDGLSSTQPRKERLPHSESRESIHVSHISTGECLTRIDWQVVDKSPVTALSYNEERGDIIAGNELGHIQIWSN
uniref:Cilia- and flagella-associated protein 43 n=1 Tax=Calcidiscus leptoporus TaxID=127549 RepID=A0A7S0JI92_9EUKA